jgi:hypothetical protein
MAGAWTALSVVVAALVIWVEGIHGFTVWNLTPLGVTVAIALALREARIRQTRIARDAFCLTALATVSLLHLAWQFDWAGTATGSSTAGLIFLFAPIYTLLASAVVGTVTWAVSALRRDGDASSKTSGAAVSNH